MWNVVTLCNRNRNQSNLETKMSLIDTLKEWMLRKFDSWLTKVGQENRPVPHDYDHLVEEPRIFTESDRIGEERSN